MDFDDARLEDELSPRADDLLRSLAETGARIRREAQLPAAELARTFEAGHRPRGVIALGAESRLVRAVLETVCPAPFVAWPFDGLPAWVGPLDLVVVLAPEGSPAGLMSAVAEAVRRGASLLVAAHPDSMIADAAASRSTMVLPMTTGDPLAAVVQALSVLHELGLGPRIQPEQVADAADAVAELCGPHRDLSANPAKDIALALADAEPLVWGGGVLSARASRRIAESLRRSTGRPALAADAEALVPVIEGTTEADPFADPVADGQPLRPVLVALDDGFGEAQARRERGELQSLAARHGVRVCPIVAADEASPATGVDRYVTLLQHGLFAAAWLGIGLGRV
ncbi:hypothetical protein [Aestuariimicrobium ganziense]|uniref:hypothetical protein n=1 Tax=Aestuariimicrobium ganziense TaxID=2773677 RepID=UPI001942AE75|nr:hypothetical protein [Aestuariimicrobium ganziense]